MKYFLTNRQATGMVWTFDLYVMIEDPIPSEQSLIDAMTDTILAIKENTFSEDTSVYSEISKTETFIVHDRYKEIFGQLFFFAVKNKVQFGFKTDGALASFIFYQNDKFVDDTNTWVNTYICDAKEMIA